MKKLSILMMVAVAVTCSQAGLLTWTGGGDGISTFQEANWDLDGATPPAGTIDPATAVQHDMLVNDPAATVGGTGAGSDLYIGDGYKLTINAGQMLFAGGKGIKGVEGEGHMSYIDLLGGKLVAQFVAYNFAVTIGGDAVLEIMGGANPINGITVDFTSAASQIHCTDETVADFTAEHLGKMLVNGDAAIIGVNLSIVSDGASGCYVSAMPESMKQAVLVAPVYGDTGVNVQPMLQWSAGPEVSNPSGYRVYLGTQEPNDLFVDYGLTELTEGVENVTQITPDAPLDNGTLYYWVVDTYEPNGLFENVYPGQSWMFTTIVATPVINSQPVSQTTTASVEFYIEASNAEVYEWYQVGTPDVLLQTTGILGTPAASSDTYTTNVEGYYYCVVTNEAGTETSQTVRVMKPQLVGHWKLDGDLTDSIQEEVPGAAVHNGICVDPNFVAVGKNGGALQFFGDFEGLVTIADSNEFFNFYPQGYTVSAWVNIPERSGSWGAYIAKQADGPQRGFILTADGNGQAVHTLRQSFNDLNANTQVDDENWHLVVGTYDAVTKEGKVYVDGVVKNQAINGGIPQAGPAPLIFGAERSTGGSAFVGILDDVRIWNYPVDPYAVAALYTDLNPGQWVCISQPELDLTGSEGVPDCKVDLYDFLAIAEVWLQCNRIPAEFCN